MDIVLWEKSLDPVERKALYLEKYGTATEVPKPRAKCPECGEEIYLKWGPVIVEPYWSHNRSDERCKWLYSPETKLHAEAKRVICNALNSNQTISVYTKCKICNEESESTLPVGIKYEMEVRQDGESRCVWDVAGVDSEDFILMGIEVRNTHATNKLRARAGVWWAEFLATEIMDTKDWKLTNVRRDQVCQDPNECTAKNKTRLEAESAKLEEEKKKRDARRLELLRKEEERAAAVKVRLDAEKAAREKKRLELEDRKKKRDELATRLGYIVNGSFTDMVDMSREEIREEVEKFSGCMCCFEEKDLSHMPYCWDCRTEIIERDFKIIKDLGRETGIFLKEKWTLEFDSRVILSDARWKNFRETSKCASCHRRTRSDGGYKRFPYCAKCVSKFETEQKTSTHSLLVGLQSNEKKHTPTVSREANAPHNHAESAVSTFMYSGIIYAPIDSRQTVSEKDDVYLKKRLQESEDQDRLKKIAKPTEKNDVPSKKRPQESEDRERRKKSVNPTEPEARTIEDFLAQFDGNRDYGPYLGISRMTRWKRAQKFGDNPPQEVMDILTDDLEKNKPPKYQYPVVPGANKNL